MDSAPYGHLHGTAFHTNFQVKNQGIMKHGTHTLYRDLKLSREHFQKNRVSIQT